MGRRREERGGEFCEAATMSSNPCPTHSFFSTLRSPLQREGPTSLVFAMPRFLKSSATSFTKFAEDVEKIIDSMQTTIDVKVEYFHDEVVDEEKRAPTGVIVLTIGN